MPDSDEKRDVRNRALGMLARREHGARELKHKLAAKGLDHDLVDAVVDELGAAGLQDDTRYVEALLHSRMARGQGPLKIKAALRDSGVAEQLIDEFVDPGARVWNELAHSVWSKKYGLRPADYQEWTRQARFLRSRGFTQEQIKHALEREAR